MTTLHDILQTEDFRIERCSRSWRAIRRALLSCREERRPYLIATTNPVNGAPNEVYGEPTEGLAILVPVSRLEEEVYKAEICTYLARKTGARILLLVANDYGTRARANAERIVTRITRVMEATGERMDYQLLQARRDSDHLMREAADRATELGACLLLLTASRDYGLDDVLFGPRELWAIRQSSVPTLLVNPRNDLFSLCD